MGRNEMQSSLIIESQNSADVLNELNEHWDSLKERQYNREGNRAFTNSYTHKCPRCDSKTRIIGKHPYCMDCNWDSLTEPSNGR